MFITFYLDFDVSVFSIIFKTIAGAKTGKLTQYDLKL